MTRYELLVMVHVVAAVAWFGGGIALVVLRARERFTSLVEADRSTEVRSP